MEEGDPKFWPLRQETRDRLAHIALHKHHVFEQVLALEQSGDLRRREPGTPFFLEARNEFAVELIRAGRREGSESIKGDDRSAVRRLQYRAVGREADQGRRLVDAALYDVAWEPGNPFVELVLRAGFSQPVRLREPVEAVLVIPHAFGRKAADRKRFRGAFHCRDSSIGCAAERRRQE